MHWKIVAIFGCLLQLLCFINKLAEAQPVEVSAKLENLNDENLNIEQSKNETTKFVPCFANKRSEFPWMVALLQNDRIFCSGSLINERTVLTAAHCVHGLRTTESLRLQLGDPKLGNSAYETRGASKVRYHRGFSMNHLQNDIALIHLDEPVSYTKSIQPVSLPKEETSPTINGVVSSLEDGHQLFNFQVAKVKILNKTECIQRYSDSSIKITPGMLCAEQNHNICKIVVSGGPLTIIDPESKQVIQFGIGSWDEDKRPSIFTSVYRYLTWIEKNQAKNLEATP